MQFRLPLFPSLCTGNSDTHHTISAYQRRTGTLYGQSRTVRAFANCTSSFRDAANAASLTFAGWNTQSDGNGTSYLPGATISNIYRSIVLYAQWTLPCGHEHVIGDTTNHSAAPCSILGHYVCNGQDHTHYGCNVPAYYKCSMDEVEHEDIVHFNENGITPWEVNDHGAPPAGTHNVTFDFNGGGHITIDGMGKYTNFTNG